MRTLKFIVDGQLIRPDPNCDFSGLVPGTSGYLKVEFAFSPEWINCVKVASFWSTLGEELEPQVINNDTCMVPAEAAKRSNFGLQVLGKRGSYTIVTNKTFIRQNGGNT